MSISDLSGYVGKARTGLDILIELYKISQRLQEAEKDARALRDLIRNLAAGRSNCLEYVFGTNCHTRNEFVVRRVNPQDNNSFTLTLNRPEASVNKMLQVNFGLLDQRNLFFENLVVQGLSAPEIERPTAKNIYAWMLEAQYRVLENRQRRSEGQPPRL